MPRSSLDEVEVEVGVEVEVKVSNQNYFFGVVGWLGRGVAGWLEIWRIKQSSNLKLKLEIGNRRNVEGTIN